MPYLQTQSDGSLLLFLYVQPRSSRTEFAGPYGNALKLRLTSPPVDGKANKAVISFLAKTFKLSKSAVQLKSGARNRKKTIQLSGPTEDEIRQLLESVPQKA